MPITRQFVGYPEAVYGLAIANAAGKLFDWKNQVWASPPLAYQDPALPNFFLPLAVGQVFGPANSPLLLRATATLPSPPAPTAAGAAAPPPFFPDGRYSCSIHVLGQPENNNPATAWEVQLWSLSDQAPASSATVTQLPASAAISGTVTFTPTTAPAK